METSTLGKVTAQEFTIKMAEQPDVVEAIYITRVVLKHLMRDHVIHPDMFENLYEIFSSHVSSHSLFILKKNNVCLGFLTYDDNVPAEFNNISWQYDQLPFFYVSRIFVLPNWRNKGVGSVLLKYAENLALVKGFKFIRIDSLTGFDEGGLFIGNDYRFAGNRLNLYQKVAMNCFEKTIEAGNS